MHRSVLQLTGFLFLAASGMSFETLSQVMEIKDLAGGLPRRRGT
jgi:hypothetical protein